MRIEPISESDGPVGNVTSVIQVGRVRRAGDDHAQGEPRRAPAARPAHPDPGAPDMIDGRTAAELSKLADALRESDIRLEFMRNDETRMIVLKLVDQTTGETLQQIPSEVSQHLAEVFGQLQGQVFSKEA